MGGGINTYAYVNGNPVNAVDPTGLVCTSNGGTVTCTQMGHDPVSFPRPVGWPDKITGQEFFHHKYNKSTNAGNVDIDCLSEYIKNHPTLNPNQNPATAEGTPNDATPPVLNSFGPSDVISYVSNTNGHQQVASM